MEVVRDVNILKRAAPFPTECSGLFRLGRTRHAVLMSECAMCEKPTPAVTEGNWRYNVVAPHPKRKCVAGTFCKPCFDAVTDTIATCVVCECTIIGPHLFNRCRLCFSEFKGLALLQTTTGDLAERVAELAGCDSEDEEMWLEYMSYERMATDEEVISCLIRAAMTHDDEVPPLLDGMEHNGTAWGRIYAIERAIDSVVA